MQQPIQRISHVQLVYPLADFEQALTQLTAVLGIEDWDRFEVPFGLAVAVSMEAGIEVVAPLTADHPWNDELRRRGAGVWAFVFGVADLDSAVDRASAAGVGLRAPAFDVIANKEGRLPEHFDVLREAPLEVFANLEIRLGQIEPKKKDSGVRS